MGEINTLLLYAKLIGKPVHQLTLRDMRDYISTPNNDIIKRARDKGIIGRKEVNEDE